jgi:REP element-mobilizing transposase RayT
MLFEQSELRQIVEEEWHGLTARFPGIHLDEFVIMPNHVHAIIWLVGAPLAGALGLGGAPSRPEPDVESSGDGASRAGASPAPTLGTVVGAVKSRVAVRWLNWIKANAPNRPAAVWQRNYYERVIRNEAELLRVREYIRYNPMKWQFDKENVNRTVDAKYEADWRWLESG